MTNGDCIELVPRKCINGKTRCFELTGIYCKHFKFSRDLMEGGCCLDGKKYVECKYRKSNPRQCEHFIDKDEEAITNG